MTYDRTRDSFFAMHGCSECATPIGTHGELVRHRELRHGQRRRHNDVCQCDLLRDFLRTAATRMSVPLLPHQAPSASVGS